MIGEGFPVNQPNLTQQELQGHIDNDPRRVHQQLIPHFENQGYDMSAVRSAHEWPPLPADVQPLPAQWPDKPATPPQNEADWDFSKNQTDADFAATRDPREPFGERPEDKPEDWDFSKGQTDQDFAATRELPQQPQVKPEDWDFSGQPNPDQHNAA